MCDVCARTASGGTNYCYDYVDHESLDKAGSCTYPPCQDPVKYKHLFPPGRGEAKLICATCRAMCPNTPGTPKDPASGKKGKRPPVKGRAASPQKAAPTPTPAAPQR